MRWKAQSVFADAPKGVQKRWPVRRLRDDDRGMCDTYGRARRWQVLVSDGLIVSS